MNPRPDWTRTASPESISAPIYVIGRVCLSPFYGVEKLPEHVERGRAAIRH